MKPGEDPQERLDHLYKLGIQMNLNRKDRNKMDVEAEKCQEECTFSPQVDQ